MKGKNRKTLTDPVEVATVKDRYIEALEEGEGQVDAAWYSDVSYSTIRRWRQTDPDFAVRVGEALA